MIKYIIIFLSLVSLSSCKDNVYSVYPKEYSITLEDIKKCKQFFKVSRWYLIKETLYDKVINDSQSCNSYYIVVDSQKHVKGYIFNAPFVKGIRGDTIKCSYLYGDYRQYHLGEPYEVPKLKKNDIPLDLIVDCSLDRRIGDIYVDSIFNIESIEIADSVCLKYQYTECCDENEKISSFCLHDLHFELVGNRPYVYVFEDESFTKTKRFYFKDINQRDYFVNDLWKMYNTPQDLGNEKSPNKISSERDFQ